MVLPVPIVPRDQGSPRGNQIRDPHPLFPGIESGLSHIAAQCYRVGKFRRQRKDSQQIAISYRPLFSRVIQGELFHGPASMRFNALENEPFAVGEAGHAARAFQGAAYSARAAQLEDSGRIHVSTDRDLRSDVRNENHVAR